MKIISLLLLAGAAGVLSVLLDPRVAQVISALVGVSGMLYFSVTLAREGLAYRGDIRESSARLPLVGLLFSAAILLKAISRLAGERPVLGESLEAFSFAAGIGALILLSGPRRRPASE